MEDYGFTHYHEEKISLKIIEKESEFVESIELCVFLSLNC